MSEIRFTVYGNAVPQARPRVFSGKDGRMHAITPRSTERWREWVKAEAVQHRPGDLWDGPLRMEIDFYLQRPKSTPRTRLYPTTKPDIDNICKAIWDSLEGILYTNDSRIVESIARKLYGDPPRVEVKLMQLEDRKENTCA